MFANVSMKDLSAGQKPDKLKPQTKLMQVCEFSLIFSMAKIEFGINV